MRPVLAPVLAAAAVLCGLVAPAAAVVVPAPPPPVPVVQPPVSLAVAPATTTRGRPSLVTARGLPGEVLALYAHTWPSTTYRLIRTARANAFGAAAWNVHPGATTRLFARPVGAPQTRSSRAAVVKVVVRPQPAPLQHGGTYTAVYLAVAQSPGAPALRQAQASARALGYEPVLGAGLACDAGALAGLGLDPARDPYAFVGLYFRTRAAAQDFADLHTPREAGVVDVRTYCLD